MSKEIFEPAIPNLLSEVILRAVLDCRGGKISKDSADKTKEEAMVWLKGEDCRLYCELINLDHGQMIRELEKRG